MSLLSTLDDITDFEPEGEEKEEGKERQEAPKLPRTNSLEDLGIKVLQFACFIFDFTAEMIKNCYSVMCHICLAEVENTH